MKEILEKIKKLYEVNEITLRRNEQAFITVRKDDLPGLITHLRDYENFSHLAFITAVDHIEKGIFQLTYMIHNYKSNLDLGLRVFIDREQSEMTSIHHLWKQAATYQRELKEMFGISFPGSPGLDEPFILEGWQEIPPMRRDFDTKEYSEKTYFPRGGRVSHDPKTYMKEKLYPEENQKEKK